MQRENPYSQCRIDTSRVAHLRPAGPAARTRAVGAVDLRVALSRVRITLSPRRRASAAAPLLVALLAWFAVPGAAADYSLDASGDRYGTISHGIGGNNYYPIHIPGHNHENAGTLLMHQSGGGDVEAYCIDLSGVRNPAAVFTGGQRHVDPIAYVLAHHYPVVPGSGALPDLNHEAAAVQLAVWAFSDGINLDGVTAPGVAGFGAVVDRARTVVRDAQGNWSAWATQQGTAPGIALRTGSPAAAPGTSMLTATVSGGPGGAVPDGTPIVFSVSSVIGTIDGQRSATRTLNGGQASVPVSAPSPGMVTVNAQVIVSGLAYLQLTPSIRPNQTLIVTVPSPVSGQGGQNLMFTGTPRLTVVKTVTDGGSTGSAVEAAPGDSLVYTIAYANSGNATASTATVTDDLGHADLNRLLGGAPTLGGGTTRSLDPATHIATWSIGDVPPGASGTVTVAGRVPMSLPDSGPGTQLCNAATLTSTEAGPVGSNSACAHVTTRPHLITTKVVDTGTAEPGQTLHYTVTVKNDGTRDLTGVVVTDALSGGNLEQLVDIRPSEGGTFDPAVRTVTWTIPSLGSGQSVSVMLDAGIPGTGLASGPDTCFINVAVAGGGNTGGSYPSTRVTTCVHPHTPGLPVTGSGPSSMATATASVSSRAPGRIARAVAGTPRIQPRIAIAVVCVLVSAGMVIAGLRREVTFT